MNRDTEAGRFARLVLVSSAAPSVVGVGTFLVRMVLNLPLASYWALFAIVVTAIIMVLNLIVYVLRMPKENRRWANGSPMEH